MFGAGFMAGVLAGAAPRGDFNPTLRSTLESTADGTSYAASAFTPPANCVLVAFVSVTASVIDGTMSGGGLVWTRRDGTQWGVGGLNRLHCFTAPVGASPASTTPTFDCTGDAATSCLMAVYSVENYGSVAAPVIADDVGGAAGDPAFDFGTVSASECCLGAFASGGSDPSGQGAPSGWAGYNELNQVTPTCVLGSAYRNLGQTATTVSFIGTDQSNWGAVGIRVIP